MKIGICAIFKNEFDFVIEWLAYHRVVGVDHFYIADNVSDDGTSELLQILDYLGYIKRVHFPRVGDVGPQAPAYNHILTHYGAEVDLLGFIDADEFIVSKTSLKENPAIQSFFDNDALSAMGLNWKVYGSSHHKLPSNNLVIEDYTKRADPSDPNCLHIKTLVKPSRAQKISIHDCTLLAGQYCNSELATDIFPDNAPNSPKTNSVTYENLHVNHYVIKSRIDQFVKKMNKGSAAGSAVRKKGVAYFLAHDKNEVSDPLPSELLTKVKQEVESIRDKINQCPHFLPLTDGHIDVNYQEGIISGWVSDCHLEWVRITIDKKEFIVPINKTRNDVFNKKLSNGPECGFFLKAAINTDNAIDCYLLSSSLPFKKTLINE